MDTIRPHQRVQRLEAERRRWPHLRGRQRRVDHETRHRACVGRCCLRSGLRRGCGRPWPSPCRLPRVQKRHAPRPPGRLPQEEAKRPLPRPVEQISPETGKRVVAPLARILFATVSRHGGRWYVGLNVHAPNLHRERRHSRSPDRLQVDWVGIDRGLTVFAVAATANGVEVGRFYAPKPLIRRLARLRRASRALSRTAPGSRNRARAARRLSRDHARIVNQRRSFLHETSTQLAKTHGKLAIEDLNVAGLIRNVRLGRAISDAAWTEFSRQLRSKASWLDGELVVCDRWFPSTRSCSRCGTVERPIPLAQRIFRCRICGLVADRDRNAAANLAAWAQASGVVADEAPDRQAGAGSPMPLEGKALAVLVTVQPAPMKGEPTPRRVPGSRTPEKGCVRATHHRCSTRLELRHDRHDQPKTEA
jgi:transposase